jgi:hypothetical protein
MDEIGSNEQNLMWRWWRRYMAWWWKDMVERGCKRAAPAWLWWFELETLMEQTLRQATRQADADTNSTMQTKKTMQRLGWFMGRDDLNLTVFLAFSWYIGRCNLDYENYKSHQATWNLIPLDRAKVFDLSVRSWYVDLVGGVRAWWSDYTCEARAPMQSLGQSPGVTDLADARSAWPARVLISTWNREQVRTNTAIKKLRMKDVCFIQRWDSE